MPIDPAGATRSLPNRPNLRHLMAQARDQCLQGRAASGLKQAPSGMNRRHSSSVRGRAPRAHKAAAMSCVCVVASLPLAGSPGASSRRAAGSSRRCKTCHIVL
jgi:hypothetical protein